VLGLQGHHKVRQQLKPDSQLLPQGTQLLLQLLLSLLCIVDDFWLC
jgi:hypothetical protein